MSIIKANKLEHISTSNGGIQLDNAGHVTVDGQQLPTAGALSNRNLIINGAMQVSQRQTSIAVTTTGPYTLDRFKTGHGGGFNINSTISQSSTAAAGFANSLKVDVTSVSTPTGSENGLLLHRIEAQNLQHLQYGTSNAQTCTLTFWVKSNKTGTYCLQIVQDDAPKYQLHEYTISSSTDWEKKTITIVGNTADAIANNNGNGLELRWHFASGSSDHVSASSTWTGSSTGYLTTSNQVNLFDSTSNEWYLTGVQLEVGEKATPFEHKSFRQELSDCLRYFEKSYNYGVAPGTVTDNGMIALRKSSVSSGIYDINLFYVHKRATPTIVLYSPGSGASGKAECEGSDQTAQGNDIGENNCRVTGTSQGSDIYIRVQYTADAEL